MGDAVVIVEHPLDDGSSDLVSRFKGAERWCVVVARTDGEIVGWREPYVREVSARTGHPVRAWRAHPLAEHRELHLHDGWSVWHMGAYEICVVDMRSVYEIWRCRDGREMLVSRMTVMHLERTMAMLERKLIASSCGTTSSRYEETRIGKWVRRIDRELAARR